MGKPSSLAGKAVRKAARKAGRRGRKASEDALTAVVTGAGGGVGGILARTLASRGWRVIALVHAYEQAQELNGIDGIEAFRLDLDNGTHVASWASELLNHKLARLDLLAHVAAVNTVASAQRATLDQWTEALAVNVVAPAVLTAGLLPALRESRGTVVFVNSGAGERGVRDHAVYAASKHALRGYADTLRLEETANGVRVSTVCPGPIATKMLHADDTTPDWLEDDDVLDPQTVADAIAWIAEAAPDVHVTNIDLRPREEIADLQARREREQEPA